MDNFESYPTHCSVCGFTAKKRINPKKAVRDRFACVKCKSRLRHRDLAQIVLDEVAPGSSSLYQFRNTPEFRSISIYEPGIRGPFVEMLSGCENYTQSYFFHDRPLGSIESGVRCEDLRALTFDDHSFDVVVSIDVFEHVFDPATAFGEILRILKPGGIHVFSVPLTFPLRKRSVTRASEVDGQIVYHRPAHYHVAGNDSKSLVVTDWGADIVKMHADLGMRLQIIRRSSPLEPHHECASLLARKL